MTEGPSNNGAIASPDLRDSFLFDLRIVENSLDESRKIAHGFMRNFAALRGIDLDSMASKLRSIIASARTAIEAKETLPAESHVPRLIHRIWLTDQDAPHEPPSIYVENLIEEAREYSSSGWTHRLWVQDPRKLPNTSAKLAAFADVIGLESINDQLSPGHWRFPFDGLISDRKYPFAADILRMKILYEYGGLYADMGARFTDKEAAEFIVDNFEYALIFWETMFFQNSLMVMPKGSTIGRTFLRLVEHPQTIPFNLLGELTGVTEGMAFSGLMITAIILSQANETLRLCPLAPNANIVSWASEKSWYTKVGEKTGRHGNAYVPETAPSFLIADQMRASQPDPLFMPITRSSP